MNSIIAQLDDVHLIYHEPRGETEAVGGISLSVHKGEFVSIVGPSGCGKTSLLSIFAGILQPSSGKAEVLGAPPDPRANSTGYMLQRDHLFDWRTIEQNALLGLEVKKRLNAETHAYAAELLLLDEPFSALDYQQRLLLADEVHSIIKRGGYTAVLVTHDISEAICMSDRVIILSERPARIRKQVEINMGSDTPLERRSNPLFREYYDAVWSEFRLAGERQQLMPTENANTQKGV